VTDRDDTRTVYVTNHPVRTLHLHHECGHLNNAGSIRETKRNRYPNRELCEHCEDGVEEPTESWYGEDLLPEDTTCPWPDCGGELEVTGRGAGHAQVRCHACSRRVIDAPDDDVPAWQAV